MPRHGGCVKLTVVSTTSQTRDDIATLANVVGILTGLVGLLVEDASSASPDAKAGITESLETAKTYCDTIQARNRP